MDWLTVLLIIALLMFVLAAWRSDNRRKHESEYQAWKDERGLK